MNRLTLLSLAAMLGLVGCNRMSMNVPSTPKVNYDKIPAVGSTSSAGGSVAPRTATANEPAPGLPLPGTPEFDRLYPRHDPVINVYNSGAQQQYQGDPSAPDPGAQGGLLRPGGTSIANPRYQRRDYEQPPYGGPIAVISLRPGGELCDVYLQGQEWDGLTLDQAQRNLAKMGIPWQYGSRPIVSSNVSPTGRDAAGRRVDRNDLQGVLDSLKQVLDRQAQSGGDD